MKNSLHLAAFAIDTEPLVVVDLHQNDVPHLEIFQFAQ